MNMVKGLLKYKERYLMGIMTINFILTDNKQNM